MLRRLPVLAAPSARTRVACRNGWCALLTLLVLASVHADEQTIWNPHGVSREELDARALACSDPTAYFLRATITTRSGRTVVAQVVAQNAEGPSAPEKVCWDLDAVDAGGRVLATQSFRIPTRLERNGTWRSSVTFHGIDAASVARIDHRRVIRTLPRPGRDERARAQELVAAYIRLHNARVPSFIESLYAAEVAYLAPARITRAALMAKKTAFLRRWDNLSYDLVRIERITPRSPGFDVVFRMTRWGVDHDGKASAATFLVAQEWRAQAEDYRITAERITTTK